MPYVTEEEEASGGLPTLGPDSKLGKTHMGCGCLAMLLVLGYAGYSVIMWLSTQTS